MFCEFYFILILENDLFNCGEFCDTIPCPSYLASGYFGAGLNAPGVEQGHPCYKTSILVVL